MLIGIDTSDYQGPSVRQHWDSFRLLQMGLEYRLEYSRPSVFWLPTKIWQLGKVVTMAEKGLSPSALSVLQTAYETIAVKNIQIKKIEDGRLRDFGAVTRVLSTSGSG